jgi:hypothetical protein
MAKTVISFIITTKQKKGDGSLLTFLSLLQQKKDEEGDGNLLSLPSLLQQNRKEEGQLSSPSSVQFKKKKR